MGATGDGPAKAKRAKVAPAAGAAAARAGPPAQAAVVSTKELDVDGLAALAAATWGAGAVGPGGPTLHPGLVEGIYRDELGGSPPPDDPAARGGRHRSPTSGRLAVLEVTQYLEAYLWPTFDPGTATDAHALSIAALVNAKFAEGVPAWRCFRDRGQAAFGAFFARMLAARARPTAAMSARERAAVVVFLSNAYSSLEEGAVRAAVLPTVGLPLWKALSPGRLQLELSRLPVVDKHWRHMLKKEAKAAAGAVGPVTPTPPSAPERLLPSLLDEFFGYLALAAPTPTAKADRDAIAYVEWAVSLLGDLLSQLPTRRFVHALLEDKAVVAACRTSPLASHPRGATFVRLTDLLEAYATLALDDHTGVALSEEQTLASHYARWQQLQRLAFAHVPKLREMATASVGAIDTRPAMAKHLSVLEDAELTHLVTRQLRLLSPDDPRAGDRRFLVEVMLTAYARRPSQRAEVNALPLYPSEDVLWADTALPGARWAADSPLALPKLNLQFLTVHDYLLRNFHLFRLEATHEIRQDVEDALSRVRPTADEDGRPRFGGWSRMALPLRTFAVTEVRKPNVGEVKPAGVTAEVVVDLRSVKDHVRVEWDALKQHDVLFLLSLRPKPAVPEWMTAEMAPEAPLADAAPETGLAAIRAAHGLVHVRGCEVVEIKDESGRLMNDFTGRTRPEDRAPPSGVTRTLVISLDTAQYAADMARVTDSGAEDPYAPGGFTLLLRRRPQENNFKAVLACIRDMMNEGGLVPDWLHDIFLGYGDPGAAAYYNLPPASLLPTVDFDDTFLDADHAAASFPKCRVTFAADDDGGGARPAPPFRVTFAPAPPAAAPGAPAPPLPEAVIEPYVPADPGPYPGDQPRRNSVRFTPTQVEAIRSGVQPGLTMVIGPPGTGKTDVAVQILALLYRNKPGERTLLVAHSNAALNDLFGKLLERDVPERYLLRLGQGERELATERDFSRAGRVNAMLERRLQLLAEVERLAVSLGIPADVGHTCETAAHFWLLHVLARWEAFASAAPLAQDPTAAVGLLFPFKAYFADAPGQPLFGGVSYAADMRRARGCLAHLATVFTELEECRPFELLKSQGDRVHYLATKQAKVIAMTCTHAALKRHEFLALGLKYDNLLMEEAAQVLEIETFIPMLLQRPQDGRSRLKRVVLIGDHHQLPPVVQNLALAKFAKMDQSLFARFVRLGTPAVQLDAQGRARPALASLYNWRYEALGDLPHLRTHPAFVAANAGFAHEWQFVDVSPAAESEPVPFFYQNLAEAEYAVTCYQYMRLMGYPGDRIALLTTYNGQKSLLDDVVERRCARHPLYGRPGRVSTVDKFQGQQADYVLLSLVRTRAVGHLRDVRRLVVALSRARLGLYIFGCRDVFEPCAELQPAFQQLLARPTKLALVPAEAHPTARAWDAKVAPYFVESLDALCAAVGQLEARWQQTALAQVQAQMAAAQAQAVAAQSAEPVVEGDEPTEPLRNADT